ncbi:MAG: FadR family transcriptional regulator [Dorea sp.]|nr:FadR family transcriptional regulator [Dorea sp.]
MKFKKINTLSIKDMFLAQIEEMILSGELKPGDKLPTEREIADAMSISKTIVHEGIRELARMGFLDVISRQGVYVADYASTGNLDTLLAIIRFRGGMPDKKMISSLLDMRIYLECPAIELLAASHTAEDIQKLTQLEETMLQAMDKDIKTFAEILFLYRRTLVVLSGNCISPLVMNAFFDASISAWADYCEFIGREATFASLVQTTDYIKNGNATGAITLFKGQIEQYRRHLHAS